MAENELGEMMTYEQKCLFRMGINPFPKIYKRVDGRLRRMWLVYDPKVRDIVWRPMR